MGHVRPVSWHPHLPEAMFCLGACPALWICPVSPGSRQLFFSPALQSSSTKGLYSGLLSRALSGPPRDLG